MAPPTELETFTCQICAVTLDGWENVKSHHCFEGTQCLALHPNNVVGRSDSKDSNDAISVPDDLDSQFQFSIGSAVQQDEPAVWNHITTKELVRLYQTMQDKFNDPGCRKKHLWNEITAQLKKTGCPYNSVQVEGKWKSLCRAVRHAKRVGTIRRSCPFYNEISEILNSKQDSIAATMVDIDSLLANQSAGSASKDSSFREKSGSLRFTSDISQLIADEDEDSDPTFPPVKRKKNGQRNDFLQLLRKNHQEQMEMENKKLQILEKMHKDNQSVLINLLETLKEISQNRS